MHFGENQLSRSLIGLSPLPTAHPLSFQPKWVRASTESYLCFTLAMGRSPRFGSRTCHYNTLISIRFRYDYPTHGLTSRHAADSQAHSSKGTPSARKPLTDCKHMVSGTISLPSRGTFHHSLTVLSTIGHSRYLGLPGGPGRFTADSTSPLLLGKHTNQRHTMFHVPGSHRLRQDIPIHFHYTRTTRHQAGRPSNNASPQHHTRNPCQVSHANGLASSTFVRHY